MQRIYVRDRRERKKRMVFAAAHEISLLWVCTRIPLLCWDITRWPLYAGL
jgi:hypothetical protein